MSPRRLVWVLYSPIGKLLARGTCATEKEARELAVAKLAAMGRKRGAFKAFPEGYPGGAYPVKAVTA